MFQKDLHYSAQIETSVIGCCILFPEAFGTLYKFLTADMFYFQVSKYLFRCMDDMFEQSRQIDFNTLGDYILRIKKQEKLNDENVHYVLGGYTKAVTGDEHLKTWANIIREMYIDREVITLQAGGWKSGNSGMDKINEVVDRLVGLRGSTSDAYDMGMDEGIIKMLQHQNKMREQGGMGITMGINTLDRNNGGVNGGELIILAARPGVGKTALMCQTAVHMAHNGVSVGLISLEMKGVSVISRIASIDTKTDYSVFSRGKYDDPKIMEEIWPTLSGQTVNLPIRICDKPAMNTAEINAQAMKWKKNNGLQALFVDYVQLVKPKFTGKNTTRENDVSQITRDLKEMSLEMDIPIFGLSQLSREVEKRKGLDRYPKLSDLRESGSLEQDADAVVFLHSDYAIEMPDAQENERDLIVRKWRNGEPELMIKMEWFPTQMRFGEKKTSTWSRVEK